MTMTLAMPIKITKRIIIKKNAFASTTKIAPETQLQNMVEGVYKALHQLEHFYIWDYLNLGEEMMAGMRAFRIYLICVNQIDCKKSLKKNSFSFVEISRVKSGWNLVFRPLFEPFLGTVVKN